MLCPLYNKKRLAAHGLRCESPLYPPTCDCKGSLTSKECTVPAVVWRVFAIHILKERVKNGEKNIFPCSQNLS